jgi:hypothetical protein
MLDTRPFLYFNAVPTYVHPYQPLWNCGSFEYQIIQLKRERFRKRDNYMSFQPYSPNLIN